MLGLFNKMACRFCGSLFLPRPHLLTAFSGPKRGPSRRDQDQRPRSSTKGTTLQLWKGSDVEKRHHAAALDGVGRREGAPRCSFGGVDRRRRAPRCSFGDAGRREKAPRCSFGGVGRRERAPRCSFGRVDRREKAPRCSFGGVGRRESAPRCSFRGVEQNGVQILGITCFCHARPCLRPLAVQKGVPPDGIKPRDPCVGPFALIRNNSPLGGRGKVGRGVWVVWAGWWSGLAGWHGGMVAWRHGGMVAWWHGGMWHGGMVAWRHGGMVAWWHGGMW